jgi:hypothetical protein
MTLLKGGTIALKHAHIAHPSGEAVMLTSTQHRKLSAAHQKGSGARLRFSKTQIRAHIRGSGFFGNLWNRIKDGVRKLPGLAKEGWDKAKPYVKPWINKGIDYAANRIHNAAGAAFGDVGTRVADAVLDKGKDYLKNKVEGLGVGKKKRGGALAAGKGLYNPGHSGMGLLPPAVKGKAASMLG